MYFASFPSSCHCACHQVSASKEFLVEVVEYVDLWVILPPLIKQSWWSIKYTLRDRTHVKGTCDTNGLSAIHPRPNHRTFPQALKETTESGFPSKPHQLQWPDSSLVNKACWRRKRNGSVLMLMRLKVWCQVNAMQSARATISCPFLLRNSYSYLYTRNVSVIVATNKVERLTIEAHMSSIIFEFIVPLPSVHSGTHIFTFFYAEQSLDSLT